jgi:hypothetical protein
MVAGLFRARPVPPDAGRAPFGYRDEGNVDFKDKAKNAKPHTRTVEICLRGDLVGEIEQLDRELVAAEKVPSTGMEDGARLRELAERIEALREEMAAEDANHTFVLHALPGSKYRALKAAHPARTDEDGKTIAEDLIVGANVDTFAEPLLRACCADPVLDDETWAIVEGLSDRQYDDLVDAALMVNRGLVNVPFSRAASRVMRNTEPE